MLLYNMNKTIKQEEDCDIVGGHCFSDHDTDDGYCKQCDNPKPNPFMDRKEYEN